MLICLIQDILNNIYEPKTLMHSLELHNMNLETAQSDSQENISLFYKQISPH